MIRKLLRKTGAHTPDACKEARNLKKLSIPLGLLASQEDPSDPVKKGGPIPEAYRKSQAQNTPNIALIWPYIPLKGTLKGALKGNQGPIPGDHRTSRGLLHSKASGSASPRSRRAASTAGHDGLCFSAERSLHPDGGFYKRGRSFL